MWGDPPHGGSMWGAPPHGGALRLSGSRGPFEASHHGGHPGLWGQRARRSWIRSFLGSSFRSALPPEAK